MKHQQQQRTSTVIDRSMSMHYIKRYNQSR
jgi:hypothetical protein